MPFLLYVVCDSATWSTSTFLLHFYCSQIVTALLERLCLLITTIKTCCMWSEVLNVSSTLRGDTHLALEGAVQVIFYSVSKFKCLLWSSLLFNGVASV